MVKAKKELTIDEITAKNEAIDAKIKALVEEQKKKIKLLLEQKKQISREFSEKQRKQRTKMLIEAGGIINLAGLLEFDKGTLLGALLSISRADEIKLQNWKITGDKLLAEREEKKKQVTKEKTEA